MSILKYFKNIPRSPSHRATGPKCNFFFFKFATKSLEKKKDLSPVGGGDRGLSPSPRATGAGPGPTQREDSCLPLQVAHGDGFLACGSQTFHGHDRLCKCKEVPRRRCRHHQGHITQPTTSTRRRWSSQQTLVPTTFFLSK